MTQTEVKQLKHGLYRFWWDSGGSSLVAVGSTANGTRWMAPTNWITVPTTDKKYWKSVRKYTKIS